MICRIWVKQILMFSAPTLIVKDSNFSVYLNSMSFPAFYLRFARAYEFLKSTQAFPLLSLYVSRITVIILLWQSIYFVCGIGFWDSFIRVHPLNYFYCYIVVHALNAPNLSVLLLLDAGAVCSSLLLRMPFTCIYFMSWMGINET